MEFVEKLVSLPRRLRVLTIKPEFYLFLIATLRQVSFLTWQNPEQFFTVQGTYGFR